MLKDFFFLLRPREGHGDGPQNREVRHGYMAGDADVSGWGLCTFFGTNWTLPARWFLKAIYEAELIQPSCATVSKQAFCADSEPPPPLPVLTELTPSFPKERNGMSRSGR